MNLNSKSLGELKIGSVVSETNDISSYIDDKQYAQNSCFYQIVDGRYIGNSGNIALSEYWCYLSIDLMYNNRILPVEFQTVLNSNVSYAIYNTANIVVQNFPISLTAQTLYSDTIQISDIVNDCNDGRYLLVSCFKSKLNEFKCQYKYNLSENKLINIDKSQINDDSITTDKLNFNIHDDKTNFIRYFYPHSYINNGKEKYSSNSWYSTNKVYLKENTNYYYGSLYAGYYTFYDENDNILCSVNGIPQGDPDKQSLKNPFIVPEGTSYGKFTKIDNTPLSNSYIALKPFTPSWYNCFIDSEKYLKQMGQN